MGWVVVPRWQVRTGPTDPGGGFLAFDPVLAGLSSPGGILLPSRTSGPFRLGPLPKNEKIKEQRK